MTEASELVAQARRDAGLTLAALAERAGTSAPTISRYENGLVDPRCSTLLRLLRACGRELTLDWSMNVSTAAELRQRFSGSPEPTSDDVTRMKDGTTVRTAEELVTLVREMKSRGLLAT